MRQSMANGIVPPVVMDGFASSGSTDLYGQQNSCSAVDVRTVQWGSANPMSVISSTIGSVTNLGAPQMYLNSGSVDTLYAFHVDGDLAVVTHSLSSYSATGTGATCISAQEVGSITGSGANAGANLFLFSRNEGGQRGHLGALSSFGGDIWIEGYNIATGIWGLGYNTLTLKNDVLPSMSQLGNRAIDLIDTTVQGDFADAGPGSLTLSNSTIGGQLTRLVFTQMTLTNGSRIHEIGASVTGTIIVDGSTIDVYSDQYSPSLNVICRNGGRVLADRTPSNSRLPANCR